MNRVLWILLVIGLSLIASILGATLAAALKSSRKTAGKKRRRRGRFEDEDDDVDTTRNAPKGAGAVVFWVLAGFGCGGLALLFGIALIVVLVKNIGDGGGGPPPPPPGFVENPDDNPGPPPVPEDLGPKEKQTQLLGATQEPTFKDQAPPGGWLIGFDVGVGEAFGVELVRAIQPRYQTPQGEAVGRKFGRNFSKTISVRARPGYAVGSIYAKAGLVVNGFSVQFMRIKGDRLDPADNYSSDWIGDHTGGGPPILLAGDGTRIIGIIGRRDANDVTGLGLLKQ